jgi:spore germination protein YaaH
MPSTTARPAGLLLLTLATNASAATPATLAYYESNSQPALQKESTSLSQIAADLYAINAKGEISGALPSALKSTAQAANIKIFATVSNFGRNGFSQPIGHAILTNPTAQAAALAAFATLAANPALAGINLDFENINKNDRAAYSAFVTALAQTLHQAGSLAVISVPAATANNPNDSWTGAYDYAAIGQACDIFQLMTYDENGPWGPPGPVAGFDWVSQSVAYTLTAVPAAKISLGMPAYGYNWDTTANTGTSIAEAAVPALIASTHATTHWDTTFQSPWLTYTAANGHSHIVWYENPRSARIKAALVPANGLAGVSVYALGTDNPAYWQALRQGFQH